MASARLWIPHEPSGLEVGTGTAWWVEANVWNSEPFTGPPGRNWDKFEGTEDGATFEWRSRDDVVREAGVALAEGRISLDRAFAEHAVAEWYDLHSDRIDRYLEEEGHDPATSEEEHRSLALREIAPQVPGADDAWSAYYDGDDRYIEEAARALELPSWARVATGEEGGMGSSYLQAFVVMGEEKSPRDLGEWLRGSRGSNG